MKHILFILKVSILIFPLSVSGQEILHVANTCDKKFVNDIDMLSTRNPDFYTYYMMIALGSCMNVAVHNGQVDKISEHFSHLGSYDSIDTPSKEYTLKKASEGDVDAKGALVLSSIDDSVSFQKSKSILFEDVPQNIKEKYIDEVLSMAEKGDVRAIFPAIAYYLHSTSRSNKEIFLKQKKAKSLFYRYTKNHVPAQSLYLAFLLSVKDISACAEDKGRNDHMDRLGFSRVIACKLVYNDKIFYKIASMDSKERLLYLKKILSNIPLHPNVNKEFDDVMNELSILSYFNAPYSKEALFIFLSMANRVKDALHWLDVNDSSSKLMKTLLAAMLIKSFDVTKPKDKQIITELKFSELLYSISFFNERKWDDFISYSIKNVLPTGNYASLYYIYMAYIAKKDGDRAWAVIEMLRKYDHSLAVKYEENFDSHHFKKPNKERVMEVIEMFSPYLPASEIAFSAIGINWDGEFKSYLLHEIDNVVKGM